jgi:hypothetical protein
MVLEGLWNYDDLMGGQEAYDMSKALQMHT